MSSKNLGSSLVRVVSNFDVFTLPAGVRPDTSGQQCHQNPNFLVKFSLIFRSLSGPNSTHFLTGQFVCRTVRPDSPVDITGKNLKWSRQGPDKDRNYHCYCY